MGGGFPLKIAVLKKSNWVCRGPNIVCKLRTLVLYWIFFSAARACSQNLLRNNTGDDLEINDFLNGGNFVYMVPTVSLRKLFLHWNFFCAARALFLGNTF